ncbi:MAG TPA: hypothetical protein VIV15_11065 [Anaerolineales bacterium]
MKHTLLAAILVLGLCLAMAQAVLAMNTTNYRVDWLLPLTGGGAGPANSSLYSANVTIGQTNIGSAGSTSYMLCAGYWCGIPAQFLLRLPVIQR